MTLHLTEEQLNDLADGTLIAGEVAAAESHLAACAVCRTELSALQQMLAEVHALPRGVPPQRDLLPEIHGQLDREPVRTMPARWRVQTIWSARYALATAAVLLIIATAVFTRLLIDRTPDTTVATPVTAPATTVGAQLVSNRATVLEQKYQTAITELQALIDAQRTSLSPTTIRLLEENLRLIDIAIRESRAALHQDPQNELINEALWSAYERKLELLRRTTEVAGI
jgi:anti-sigma factor RsiW